jgi:enoyl-CoA hydratase/carnithine racemase
MIMTARLMTAGEALASGFVAEIVPADQLETRVTSLCQGIMANAPITLATTRTALRRILHAGLPEGDDLIRQAYGSRDFQEGVAAFLARRPPEWRGE